MLSIISPFTFAISLMSLKFSIWASDMFVIIAMSGRKSFDKLFILPSDLLIPISKTPYLSVAQVT